MIFVSNNPLIKENQNNHIWIEGTPANVIEAVLNLLDKGYHLLHSPLSPNNRLNKSPYRTVVLTKEKLNNISNEYEIVINALDFIYSQKITENPSMAESFQWLDNMLVENIISAK